MEKLSSSLKARRPLGSYVPITSHAPEKVAKRNVSALTVMLCKQTRCSVIALGVFHDELTCAWQRPLFFLGKLHLGKCVHRFRNNLGFV